MKANPQRSPHLSLPAPQPLDTPAPLAERQRRNEELGYALTFGWMFPVAGAAAMGGLVDAMCRLSAPDAGWLGMTFGSIAGGIASSAYAFFAGRRSMEH